ncbi:MAG: di-trans,poly-cis-decaprenylcistransferase [Alphaproteobacteria bacterium]|nr:di-trans,poly-cis-decaprenylcistransferase [Alphaproteobacteria bacterium]
MRPVPRHLAIIPDGNRRWARARGLAPADGHRAGVAALGPVLEAAWDAGVEVCSFWWGSPANLTRRKPEEVAVITGALNHWLAAEGVRLVAPERRFHALGRWAELCPEIRPGVEAVRAAAGPGPQALALLMAYDGRDEIRAAADARGGGGASARDFEAALWTSALPPVDLVIRTGGEPHLSAGFLLWHIAEARLHFSPLPWPAFTPDALALALREFADTERRFGA